MDCDENNLFKDDIEYLFNSYDGWPDKEPVFYHNFNHAVLFELPMVNEKLIPHQASDLWDQNHVRLPCSKESQYPELINGVKELKSRWELIQESLLREFNSTIELELAIKSYNTRYESIWKFDTLHNLIHNQFSMSQRYKFFKKTLPGIISLALRLPHIIQCAIPLLKKGMNKSISMTQEQAATILANSFLCTFPRRNTDKRNSEYSNYPDINFQRLFEGNYQVKAEKLKCIINYFERVTSDMPNGVLTFTRRSIDKNQIPNWKEDTKSFKNIKYFISSQQKIENASAMLQVDFANKFIGGGVLGNGSVQEEIRMCINPELIVSRLFTECLSNEESFVITGAEQFNLYTGYASTFQFAGNFIDQTPSDNFRRKKCRIVAIDAINYRNYQEQFKESYLIRELNKAYSGFYNPNDDQQYVATGLWGCGAFNGHPIKSALVQFMACRLNRRHIVFLTFNDEIMKVQIDNLFKFLIDNSVTVSRLFNILKKYQASSNTEDLANFIKSDVKNNLTKSNISPLGFNLKNPSTSTSFVSKQPTISTFFNFTDFSKSNDLNTKNSQEQKEVLKFKSPPSQIESMKEKFDRQRNRFKNIRENGASLNHSKKAEDKKPKSLLLEALDDDFCDKK